MAEKILTEEDYKQILKNFTSNKVEYVSSKISYISNGGVEGFMGDYFTLEITYVEENIKKMELFFGKTRPTHTEIQEHYAKQRKVYEKESFFYDFFMKEFKKLGYDTSFAPNCYFCKDNNILILENLISKQYSLSEKSKLYNLDQIKSGLKSLALFHSSCLLFEEEMSKKNNKIYRIKEECPDIFFENYLDPDNDPDFSTDVFTNTVEIIQYVVDNSTNYKTTFMELLTPKNCLHGLLGNTNLRQAIGHGDLWYNNIFFRNNDCKIVDYQILRYCVPTFDVQLFIHLNTSKEFRKEHLENILEYYYKCFEQNVSKYGYDVNDIMTKRDYENSLKFTQTSALFSTLSIGKMTFMPQELLQKFYDGIDHDWKRVFTEVYITGMETEVEFRKIITDSVDDLHYSIFRDLEN